MGIKLKGKNSLSKNFSIYIQQKRVHGTLQKFTGHNLDLKS